MKNKILHWCGAAALAICASMSATAQAAYPDRPVKLVVPFPAGGTPDILARLMSEVIGKDLGQTVIVENRPGAAGNIGAQYVARSQPDGYTLLVCTFSCNVAQWIYKPSPFDPLKDLDPIIMLGTVPSVLVVGPSVKFKSVAELVTYAKSHPGKLPTFIEAGYPNFLITPWFGVLAPANTPPEIVERLNRSFNAALAAPALRERISQLGVDIAGGTRATLVKFISEDTLRWKDVVQKSGIHVEE
jgi:tripartite-type tricarboxylate transporter receptor subunit TctC